MLGIQPEGCTPKGLKPDSGTTLSFKIDVKLEGQAGRTEGLEEGRKQGMEKGKEEVALNCVIQGMASNLISQMTGLTVEEIEKLKTR